jgi:hypothetical protein
MGRLARPPFNADDENELADFWEGVPQPVSQASSDADIKKANVRGFMRSIFRARGLHATIMKAIMLNAKMLKQHGTVDREKVG